MVKISYNYVVVDDIGNQRINRYFLIIINFFQTKF